MSSYTPARAGKGYQASKDQLLDRLTRIKGQVGGVERMVEEDRYCIDVLTQISAIQAALFLIHIFSITKTIIKA